jgi:hypothetical protein
MNTYQKVIVCIIRSVAVGLLLYSIAGISVALLIVRSMWRLSLIGGLPLLASGLLLYLLAVPLAKLITSGIRDE